MQLRSRIVIAYVVALAGLASPERGTAQDAMEPPAGEVFGYLKLAVPIGDFGDHVNLGGGGGFGGMLFLGGSGRVGLRADGNFIIYGSETTLVPLSSTVPVQVEVETTNTIFSGGLGPQVYFGRGSIRPYFYGTVGLSAFVTSTGISGRHEARSISSTTDFKDFRLALTGGGGLSFQVRGGESPVSVDLSASYQYNGETQYLTSRPDNIGQSPSGDWVPDPTTNDANLLAFQVGVSVGIR